MPVNRIIALMRTAYGPAPCRLLVRAVLLLALSGPMAAGVARAQESGGSVPVIVSPVRYVAEFADTVEALGTTRANESVEITANVTETVQTVNFTDGERVATGDVLVVLEKAEEEAELRAAQALMEERRASFERASELEQKRAVSTAILREREALLKQIEGNIEAIRARIADRVIRAPFNGRLGLRNISPGALVRPGDMITTIDDLDPIKVDFQLPSMLLQGLHEGLRIRGRVQALGDRMFDGEVSMIATQVDPVTRSVTVRALLPNEELVLRPGLLMNITLLHDVRPALLVPEEALIQQDTRKFVMAINESEGRLIAEKRQVVAGRRVPGEVEIIEGIGPDDHVVVHGLMQVRPGDAVSIRAVKDAGQPLQKLLDPA